MFWYLAKHCSSSSLLLIYLDAMWQCSNLELRGISMWQFLIIYYAYNVYMHVGTYEYMPFLDVCGMIVSCMAPKEHWWSNIIEWLNTCQHVNVCLPKIQGQSETWGCILVGPFVSYGTFLVSPVVQGVY